MAQILFGQYSIDEGMRTLQHVLTGQLLQFKEEISNGHLIFTYQDRDVTITFPIRFQKTRGIAPGFAAVGVMNWSCPELEEAAKCYGLWRRMTYFLLDSLMVWLYPQVDGKSEDYTQRVDILGSWRNGAWFPNSMLQSVLVRPEGITPNQERQTTAHPMCSLEALPSKWRYIQPRRLETAVELVTRDIFDGIPVLDCTKKIYLQLCGAPRFEQDNTHAVLYHREIIVHFHRGEDYDPSPKYGYLNNSVGFSFIPSPIYGLDFHQYSEPFIRNKNDSYKQFFKINESSSRIELTKLMKEELFFAVLDVLGAMRESLSTGREMPIIKEHKQSSFDFFRKKYPEDQKNWNGIRFGSYLDSKIWIPLGSSMGDCGTYFYQHWGKPLLSFRELMNLGYEPIHPLKRSSFSRVWPFSKLR